MGNLIDRVYSFRKVLSDMVMCFNKGGLLIVVSFFIWFEEYIE